GERLDRIRGDRLRVIVRALDDGPGRQLRPSGRCDGRDEPGARALTTGHDELGASRAEAVRVLGELLVQAASGDRANHVGSEYAGRGDWSLERERRVHRGLHGAPGRGGGAVLHADRGERAWRRVRRERGEHVDPTFYLCLVVSQ